MKRLMALLKWIGGILCSFFLLFVVLACLLYIPAVQNFVVKKVAAYASEKTGMAISMKYISLGFPLDLKLDGAQAIRGNDTLFVARTFIATIKLKPLFHSRVELDRARLVDAKVNTLDFIKACNVSGNVGDLDITARNIALKEEAAVINSVLLKNASLRVSMNDSVPPDTTPTKPVYWRILAEKVRVVNTRVAYSAPPSQKMKVAGVLQQVEMANGYFDLGKGLYQVQALRVDSAAVNYDANDIRPAVKGLDPNHIALRKLSARLDSIENQGMRTHGIVRSLAFEERCGLRVNECDGRFAMDSLFLHLPEFRLLTDDSRLFARADLNWDAFTPGKAARMWGRLFAVIGKQDVLKLAGNYLPQDAVRYLPNVPLTLRAGVDGNVSSINIPGLQMELPGMFRLQGSGEVNSAMDEKKRNGHFNLKLNLQDISFFTRHLNLTGVKIPRNIRAAGKVAFAGPSYSADLKLEENGSRVDLKGHCNLEREDYSADMRIRHLQLQHFVDNDSLRTLSGDITLHGKGFNPMSSRCVIYSKADVHQFDYGHYTFKGFNWNATLKDNRLNMDLKVNNDYLLMSSRIVGHLQKDRLYSRMHLNVVKADLQRMGLQNKEFKVGGTFDIDLTTDMKERHLVRAALYDTHLTIPQGTFYPLDWNFTAFTRPDSSFMDITAGDLRVRMQSRNSFTAIMDKARTFAAQFAKMTADKSLDQNKLKACLPDVALDVTSGKMNPLNRILRLQGGMEYDTLVAHVRTSPEKGVFTDAHIFNTLVKDVQLDTIRFAIREDTAGIVNAYAQIKNGPKNKQYVFNSLLKSRLNEKGMDVGMLFFDKDNVKGVDAGFNINFMDEGWMIRALNKTPVLAYQTFQVNDDNYIYISKDNRIKAHMKLISDKGMGLSLYSTDNPDAEQDLTLSLHQVDLAPLLSTLPYLPRMSGMLEGDVRFVQKDKVPSITSEASITNFVYEGSPMGNVGASLAYMPREDGTHIVNGEITRNDQTVLTLDGGYKPGGKGLLDANLDFVDFPLDMANGFIPNQMTSFEGHAKGSVTLKGDPDKPVVSGKLNMEGVKMRSALLSLDYKIEDQPVIIDENVVSLDDVKMYGPGKEPMVVNGKVDFKDLEEIKPDLTIRARNFTVLNAKRTLSTMLYGKAYVNLYSRVTGSLNNLAVRGGIQVLGNTDVTYVLQDTPLTVEDRLSDIVTFTDFNAAKTAKRTNPVDSIRQTSPKKQFTGVSMNMGLSIEQGAQIKCNLSANQESYVNLEGGGDLTMKYTSEGGLQLAGRYMLNNGEMKYELPVIPLKTFTIANGSYVEFTGNPMNPRLNITATERTRALVGAKGETQRSVNFDVGVVISQTLEKMGLQFTLDAPDDASVQQELSAMSAEERGKLAVTMLSTGMYLGGGAGFDINNAMNVFLQSEISKITGSALKTVDLSLGMDNTKDETGASRTDYSFKFSKRFWGNRLIVNIGGTVSSGNSATANNEQSLINDVSIEYRLDNSGTRYVRLYHYIKYDDLLDGNVQVTGAGFVLRKKMTKFGELFIFRNKKQLQPVPSAVKSGGRK